MSTRSWPVLGTMTQKTFLAKYWQKRPVLLKGALVPFPEIITPDEVLGMSLDERVESRLIREKGGATPWETKRGPFKASLFKKLPPTHWTVLVNGVDRFVPAVQAFADHFSFIPFWRMDDIMISVAVDQGNVGAHVDNYDVFLVQAHGTREWLIEDKPRLTDEFVPGLPIRLLKRFKPTHRWLLEPGDILYLPPRIPHHGIARGDECMTISVGYRAPTHDDILNSLVTKALGESTTPVRYSDPDLTPQQPGEISAGSIAKVKEIVREKLLSDDFIGDWLGAFASETYPDVDLSAQASRISASSLAARVKRSSALIRTEGARFAFIRKGGNKITFYHNGESRELSGKAATVAEMISNSVTIESSLVLPFIKDKGSQALLLWLLQSGALVLE
jgi:50S ribosomal protein L16 3-hydroxylase